MNSHTLILTPWYTPHQIVGWQEAICKVYSGDAKVLAEYDEEVSSPSVTMKIPSVLVLTPKRPLKAHKSGVKYSWINILTRDKFTCAYCGNRFPIKKLNRDHVKPRCQGGPTVWENIVTSCKTCNSRKDGRTPEQAGMKLLHKPFVPKTLPISVPFHNIENMPEAWKPYCDPKHVPAAG